MLSRSFFASNRRKLHKSVNGSLVVLTAQSLLQRSGDTTYPFRQDSNFFYLTGIHEPDVVLVMVASEEFLILPKRSEIETTFSGAINADEIKKISGVFSVFDYAEGWEKFKKLQQNHKEIFTVGQASPKVLAADSFFTNPARRYLVQKLKRINRSAELKDLRPILGNMRQIKQAEELEAIKIAIEITGEGFKKARESFNDGASEYELEALFDYEFKRRQVAHGYHPIVAGGRQACVLHYIKNSQELTQETMCLLDVGAEYFNYSADITRMFVKNPNKRQQQVLEAVKRVQQYAMNILQPGLAWKDLTNQVEQNIGEELIKLNLIQSITRENVRKYFPHGISHSLGLDVHDVCDYRVIQEGMVITVEPGIYIPEEDIGVRIEDDVLISKTGVLNLSKDIPYV